MKIVTVLAPWSSGSTSIAGYLQRVGGYDCPPNVMTNDPRTPNSHEPKELRDFLAQIVDEFSLQEQSGYRPLFNPWFQTWISKQIRAAQDTRSKFIVLKHPLLAYFINELSVNKDVEFVCVKRDLRKIEATKVRRQWSENYGEWGAKKIYSRIYSDFLGTGNSMLTVDFSEFRENTQFRKRLLSFYGIQPTEAEIDAAEAWVR